MFDRLQVFYFLLFIFLTSAGQEIPPFNNYLPASYGAGNQNWDVTQDTAGNMYFANEQGLLQYNGAQWQLYKTPNESVMRSVLAQGDRIYSGCYMDFGYWEEDDQGNLVYESLPQNFDLQIEDDEQFWNIISTDKYILFQSLNAIYSYNRENRTVDLLVKEKDITKLFKTSSGFFYQVQGKGLFEIKSKTGIKINDSELATKQMIVSMFDDFNQTYVVLDNGELYALKNSKFEKVLNLVNQEDVQVYSAVFLPQERSMILGTVQKGVIGVDLDGKQNLNINRKSGLANNTVLSMYAGKTGSIWLGLDNGISNINNKSPFNQYIDQLGVLGTVYASISFEGRLFLGTNQGLFVENPATSNFDFIKGTSGQVWSLSKVNGKLLCHHDAGLFEVEDKIAKPLFSANGVWDSHYDKLKNTLVCGTYSGLIILDWDGNNFVFRNKMEGFDISSKDFAVTKNTIFVGHEYKGVYKLEIKSDYGSVKKVDYIDNVKTDVTSDLIYFSGDILFSNSAGIHVWNETEQLFKIDEKLSRIYKDDQFISGKLVDTNDGNLWAVTRDHLIKIDQENIDGAYDIEKYAISSEVRSEKRGYENISNISGNEYLVGTTYGYISFNSGAWNTSDFEIVINEILKKQDEKFIDINSREDLVLSNDQNGLKILFNTAVYNALHPTLYQYRLNEDEWGSWDSSSQVTYNNLPAGTHTFEVRSKVNSTLSSNVASISFEIKKPFYASNVALICYLILILVLGLAIHYAYNWYFKRQKQREYLRYQKDLEVVNLQNENELIQLRNDKLRSDMDHRSKELAVATMGTIKKNEILKEIGSIVSNLPESPASKELKKVIKNNLSSKKDWISFEEAFNNADKDFFKKIKEKHPNLTTGDLRLCVYLRLNLSSKEIAPLLHISHRSVEIKRYRLRKKMELGKEVNLNDYILKL